MHYFITEVAEVFPKRFVSVFLMFVFLLHSYEANEKGHAVITDKRTES